MLEIIKNTISAFFLSLPLVFSSALCKELKFEELRFEELRFEELRFEKLSLENGVAHDLTYCIFQDSRGFIWFGTMNGLARFDGRNYQIFRNDPDDPYSISFDDILTIYEDNKGYLWIGTWGGGLNRFDHNTERFYRYYHDPKNPSSISDNIIWSITEDKHGSIWCGTDNGLNKLPEDGNKFIRFIKKHPADSTFPGNSVRSLLCDKKGTLWIGTNSGIARYDEKTGRFSSFLFDARDHRANHINTLYEDHNNHIWAGTLNGLFEFTLSPVEFTSYRKSGSPSSISSNTILSVTEDNKGIIWIGTVYGLNRLDRSQNSFSRFYHDPSDPGSISTSFIKSLYSDRTGILWISAYNGGVNRLKPAADKFQILRINRTDNLPTNPGNVWAFANVRAIAEDLHGNIWFGTFGSGLKVLDKKTGEMREVKTPENFITSLAADKKGKLWIGQRSGLISMNISNKEITPLPRELKEKLPGAAINALLVTENGSLLIATMGAGFYIFDGSLKHYTFESHGSSHQALNSILSLGISGGGEIWLGTYGGLIRLVEKTGRYKIFTHQQSNPFSLSHNYVFSILTGPKGGLWIGTGSGLNRFNPADESFTRYYEKDGLPNNVIAGLALENPGGALWISTNYGLSRFDPETGRFENYDRSDGLPGNLFNLNAALKSSEGYIYFGSRQGLIRFHPERIVKSGFNPPVLITAVYADSRRVFPDNGKIELDHGTRSVRIEAISLDYTNPVKNRYSHILEGFDTGWKDTGGRNSVEYSGLPPGSYTFKMRGSNSDGILSSKIASFELFISPPYWQRWWFRLLIISLLVLITLLVHYIRLRNALRLQRLRQEENERIRRKTATDFHDELGHRLTRISLLTEMIKRNMTVRTPELTGLLDNISINSYELYEGTRDFIWAIDPKNDSLYELLVRLKDFGDEIFSHTTVSFSFSGISEDLKNIKLSSDFRRETALIFKEALNNSLKHADACNVNFSAEVSPGKIILSLEDDGKGFDPMEKCPGNGLSNMKKRAERIGMSLEIISVPAGGTKVILCKGNIRPDGVDFR